MTLKNMIEKVRPELIDEDYDGGVKGCPFEYPETRDHCSKLECGRDLWHHDKHQCEKCWNQKYIEKADDNIKKIKSIIGEDDYDVIYDSAEKSYRIDCTYDAFRTAWISYSAEIDDWLYEGMSIPFEVLKEIIDVLNIENQTLRDVVKRFHPECVDKKHVGGVIGCPEDYAELREYDYNRTPGCSVVDSGRRCTDCWNQKAVKKGGD